MSLLRATIDVISALRTPLKGDTIWGHVACGIANHEGEEGVKAFCNLDTPFVVSSAFPHNMLPKPLLKPEEKTEEFESKEDYTRFKAIKKQKYVNASTYLDIAESKECNLKFKEHSMMHVSVSRNSGAAIDGELYSATEIYGETNGEYPKMDIYISSDLEKERVLELLNWAFEFGYGADTSLGKGRISVENTIEEIKVKEPFHKRYMALGPFIGDDALEDLRATTFLRKGRIGGLLATDISPYKKSLILYDEGSTFISKQKKEYVGSLLHNMHFSTDYDICHAAFAPVIEV